MIGCSHPLAQFKSRETDILRSVERVLQSGSYILGAEVASFEKNFSAYCASDYGVGVNSGTDALVLALRSLDIGPGDEVITVSHTALATVAAIVACGATPVMVDVDPSFFTLDPDKIESAITPETKAIVPVHIYGQCADMDPILEIAGDRDLFVVEDCAQAAGASYRERPAGSMGDIGCFSFYPTKNLGAIGDGGMIVTSDEKIAQRVESLRQYGWDSNREPQEPGLNSRLDEIQAAILNIKLKYLDRDNQKRIEISKIYGEHLSNTEIITPETAKHLLHAYHLYVVQVGDRDKVLERLRDKDILAGVHYPRPIHLQKGYMKYCRLPAEGLPETEQLSESIVSLPIYPELTVAETMQVIEALG
ncbi:MAG: DegT/DnrJ/EryC1/StrS family aminotransferase [Gammaproteobacteria bacterium]|nr:DegT/DnrJ/EryC1/StrS family aminotransferase [Gammaproteobacteria bacterium]